MKHIDSIVLSFALLTPCMPKVGISEELTIYPVEILLLIFCTRLYKYNKFTEQKLLIGVWGFILFSTILSCIGHFSIGGILRCVKELIYIPIVFLAYSCRWLTWRSLSVVFIIASAINFVFLIYAGFNFSSIDIWDPSLLSSGMSNKYFDINSLSLIVNSGKGSHGIFSDYCVLSLCVSYIAYYKKQINKRFLIVAFIMVIASVGMSVSREGLVVLCFFLISIVIISFKYGSVKYRTMSFLYLFFFIVGISYIISEYGENIALINKIVYTQNSIEDSGSESNVALRLGSWTIYLESIIKYPYMLIIGYGYNTEFYESFLTFARNAKFEYVTVPESFFVECIMFGGVMAFYFGIKWWRKCYLLFKKIPDYRERCAILGLFWGLLFVNSFSGASIVSDLLYCQFLILLGLVIKDISGRKMVKDVVVQDV